MKKILKIQSNKAEINWFEDWFNSPYYHLLYKERDFVEAEYFISNILNYLTPKKNAKILDVACGKGRHSIFLNKQGFATDGFDLSENSILEAKKNETSTLKFFINDIREPLKTNFYDFAFNVFTSFGYFIDEKDNQKSINAIAKSLTKGGVLIIDFLNSNYTVSNLKNIDSKTIENITFNITKKIEDGFVVKHIKFTDMNTNFHYTEKVKLLRLADFKNYLTKAGLTIEATFGDYSLNSFNENNSERLIIIAKK